MVVATVFGKIISIFMIMLVGILCYKVGFIDNHVKQKLSSIVNMIVVPAIIFSSLQMDYDPAVAKKMAICFAIAMASYVLSIIIANLLLHEKDGHDLIVEKMSVIFSNCGFIGIPLCGGLFGNMGVIYATIFVAGFHVFMWTYGIVLMSGGGFNLKKILSPCLIAIILGFTFFMLRIQLPESIKFAVDSIGSMNTPLAMVLSGSIIAQLDLRKSITKIRMYYVAILRVIIVPLIMCIILRFLPIDAEMRIAAGVVSACPSGAMTITMSVLYGRDDHYATEIFTITTIMSLVTIPLMMLVLG